MTSRVALQRVESPDSSAAAVAQWLAANPTVEDHPRGDDDDLVSVLFGDDDERSVSDDAAVAGLRALSMREKTAVIAATAAAAAAGALLVWQLWPSPPQTPAGPGFQAAAWVSELRAEERRREQSQEIARSEAEAEEAARAAASADQSAAEEGTLVPPADPSQVVTTNDVTGVEKALLSALAGIQAAQATALPGSPEAALLAGQAAALQQVAANYGLSLPPTN